MGYRIRSDNLIILTLLGALMGFLYSFAENALRGTELIPLMFRAISCMVLVVVSISFASRGLKIIVKGKTFLFSVLLRSLSYFIIIIFWLGLINGISDAILMKGPVIMGFIDYLRYSDMLWPNLLTVFISVLIIVFILDINTLHRKGELIKFIFGLYRKPGEVDRVFMFADMKSSTSIAEKIGNLKFGMLLQDFFSDISDAVSMNQGEVYGYVGDEIIVSWKYNKAVKNNQCIRCFFEMQKIIRNRSDNYLKKYGIIPGIKAGMHTGKVVVMWVGEQKKEIVYLGDVLNTTSRIQAECNRLDEQLLVSGKVVDQLPGLDAYISRPMGEIELRGKEEKVLLFGIKET